MATSVLRGLIPQKFQSVDAIMELVDAIGELQAEDDWQLIQQLATQRYPDQLDPNLLPYLASFLGFKFDADWFDQANFKKMVETVSQYYQYKGTNDTFEYFGWLTDTVWTVKNLWTNDYNNFQILPQNGGTPYEGYTLPPQGYAQVGNGLGGWWQSPHVQLWYDADQFSPERFDIQSMFKFMAPIQLVLDAVVAAFYTYAGLYISMGGVESDTDGEIPDGIYGIWQMGGMEIDTVGFDTFDFGSFVIQMAAVERNYIR